MVGQGVGVGVGRGVGLPRGTGSGESSGVAIGCTGNADVGVNVLSIIGGGVTIAVAPLGCAVKRASVFAGSTDPAPSTKFFPCRAICHNE